MSTDLHSHRLFIFRSIVKWSRETRGWENSLCRWVESQAAVNFKTIQCCRTFHGIRWDKAERSEAAPTRRGDTRARERPRNALRENERIAVRVLIYSSVENLWALSFEYFGTLVMRSQKCWTLRGIMCKYTYWVTMTKLMRDNYCVRVCVRACVHAWIAWFRRMKKATIHSVIILFYEA